jgi:hypothetical protein
MLERYPIICATLYLGGIHKHMDVVYTCIYLNDFYSFVVTEFAQYRPYLFPVLPVNNLSFKLWCPYYR